MSCSRFLLTLVAALCALHCGGQPRIEATSIYALHESTRAMKQELNLSATESAALDQAIDVLVGDAMREVLAKSAPARPGSDVPEAEARAIAPIDDLTFEELVRTATTRKQAELEALRQELFEEEKRVAEDEVHLAGVRVLRAGYGMSSSRRSWIDVTLANHTDRTLGEVLLDCRLVERGEPAREKGTCAVALEGGLEPGETRAARTYVGWDTTPSSRTRLELRPIRAYDPVGAVLWRIPSRLDPREAGRSGELRNRLTVVEETLDTLEAALPQEP